MVNLNEPMAQEAVTRLIQLGVSNINYIPYYPGEDPQLAEGIWYAITPDESRYVPKGVVHVIDELFVRALRLESSFQSLIDIMDIGIIGINEQGALFICNKKAETIVGRDLADAIGQQSSACSLIFPWRNAGRAIRK